MGNFNRDSKPGPKRGFRPGGFGKRSFGDRVRREMHKAVCSKCGKDCQVPFAPTSGKPVYCSECFEKRGGGDDLRKPNFERTNQSVPQNSEQLEAIKIRLDKIIELLTITPPLKATTTPKKKKTLKKKPPVKKE